MLNLLKMERYRACKEKVTIITVFIMALISFLSVFASTNGIDSNEGINISNHFIEMLSSPMTLIIWAIMISVYISAEYKNGFVKSIAGQIKNKGYLALSKLMLLILYTVVMFVVCFIFTSLSAFIFSGDNLTLDFSSEIIFICCSQFLLYVGFGSIFILIATITRSSALGIGLGIFTGCGLTSLFYSGISWIVNKTGVITDFDFGSYMIETNLQFTKVGIPSELILRAALVGLAFIIIMTFASMKTLNKRDI